MKSTLCAALAAALMSNSAAMAQSNSSNLPSRSDERGDRLPDQYRQRL
jgi:hypothetical protein